ncbi:MAG: primosomal protein N', partial [Nonomuraea sp.]|nr:primosomal protein N' [Nonomuraea sp.]
VEESDHEGRLTPLERVVSPEQVLTPEIAGLARAVADRYAGTLTDVLRLAVPPRHAKAESEVPPPEKTVPEKAVSGETGPETASPGEIGPEASGPEETCQETTGLEEIVSEKAVSEDAVPKRTGAEGTLSGEGGPKRASLQEVVPEKAGSGRGGGEESAGGAEGAPSAGSGVGFMSAWDAYPTGPSFLDALRHGRAPRAVWSALPGATGWAAAMAEAVGATLDGGRGAVVVVPDGKDVALADVELDRVLGPGRHVALTADLGPAERYRRWLKVLRGQVRAVVGTRAAMFAPVADLGLVAIWDDGDDLHAERLAPYPHAREVLGLRALRTGAAMLIGGYARTAEATQLIASRWARPITATRTTIRSLAPRVRPAGEDAELAKDQAARQARLPSLAWRALRQGLESGPVLVQVPRRGYLPALACQHCRAPARCVLPPTRIAPHLAAAQPPGAGRIPPTAPGTIPLGSHEGPGRSHEGPGRAPGSAGQGTVFQAGQGTVFPADHGTVPGSAGQALPGSGGQGVALPEGSSGQGAAGPSTGLGSISPGAMGPGAMGPGSVGAGFAGVEAGRAGEARCHGPLALRGGHAAPYCRWCGRVDAAWRCPSCGSPRLRAVVTGARRTAEELGRAFPSVQVRTSGRDGVLARVPATRALVVATPGAEPVAEGGYAAAVLLDGWALLGRADLRAGEETVRRWMNAAALLRPSAELVVLGDAGLPAVQALLRWDPVTHAERELGDRAELGFPPAVRMATLTGSASAVRQMLDEVRLPPDAEVLGPVPVDESGLERAMIRVRRAGGAALAAALKGASGVRAARKTPDVVRVSVDPLDLI